MASILTSRGCSFDCDFCAIVLFRQPRSVRHDGPIPRRLVAEVMLTAWDAAPGAHRLERRIGRWRARLRPTLTDVLRQTHEI